ncbi:MAG: DsbE family thiol:disulfide interchange protein [Gammaproteobacteria bacterium]|nr:DsbE family thiol:disulfide interchange protein [Gammaproteobacteria bacterium]MBI5615211.1 DsbE family thiol:disulfide interchange protein [Gammaproteobacteria bacterium]
MRFAIPLAIFIGLVILLARGLHLDPRLVPSPLIGKPAPEFSLTKLSDPAASMTKADLAGRPVMLNVWSSWCGACREEHPLLVATARTGEFEIFGLNYKDTREDAKQILARAGNPYKESLFDPEGRLGLDLGVYGVPETFILDGQGVIRFKQVGPITPEVLNGRILPLMRELRGSKT